MDHWFYSKELQPRQSVFDLSFVLVPQVNVDFKPGALIFKSTPYDLHACFIRFSSNSRFRILFCATTFYFYCYYFFFHISNIGYFRIMSTALATIFLFLHSFCAFIKAFLVSSWSFFWCSKPVRVYAK
jgi:hypothetical protein